MRNGTSRLYEIHTGDPAEALSFYGKLLSDGRERGVLAQVDDRGASARLRGDTVLESAEADGQRGRYDIVVSGGASDIVVQRG